MDLARRDHEARHTRQRRRFSRPSFHLGPGLALAENAGDASLQAERAGVLQRDGAGINLAGSGIDQLARPGVLTRLLTGSFQLHG